MKLIDIIRRGKCIKTIPLIFFIVFSFLPGRAQQWDDAIIQNPGTGKFLLGISANADYNSNGITNSFAENFLEGNYISDDIKQQAASHLHAENRAGAMLNAGI